MRLPILIVLFSFFGITLNSNNAPPFENEEFFTIEAINFKMSMKDMRVHGMRVDYNLFKKDLSLSLEEEVHFLQVFDDKDQLEFQVPVFSKNVIVDLNDFTIGHYKMNLLLSDDSLLDATFTKK